MLKYTIKRILLLIPTLFIVLTIVFVLMKLVPGSPIYAMTEGEEYTPEELYELEAELGFHDPIIVQYGRYVAGIFKGDWGTSYLNSRPVFDNMMKIWEPAILMAFLATFITVIIALPVGVLSATHRNSFLDYFVSSASTVSMTISWISSPLWAIHTSPRAASGSLCTACCCPVSPWDCTTWQAWPV